MQVVLLGKMYKEQEFLVVHESDFELSYLERLDGALLRARIKEGVSPADRIGLLITQKDPSRPIPIPEPAVTEQIKEYATTVADALAEYLRETLKQGPIGPDPTDIGNPFKVWDSLDGCWKSQFGTRFDDNTILRVVISITPPNVTSRLYNGK